MMKDYLFPAIAGLFVLTLTIVVAVSIAFMFK